MMGPRGVARHLAAAAAIVAGAAVGSRLFRPVPDAHPIAIVTGQELSFGFQATDHPPYQLLLALPRPKPQRWLRRTAIGLHGNLELTDPRGRSLIVPLTRETMRRTGQLDGVPGMAGWILDCDHPQQLNDYLRRGLRYRVTVRLDAPARTYATLWLATVRHRSMLFGREM